MQPLRPGEPVAVGHAEGPNPVSEPRRIPEQANGSSCWARIRRGRRLFDRIFAKAVSICIPGSRACPRPVSDCAAAIAAAPQGRGSSHPRRSADLGQEARNATTRHTVPYGWRSDRRTRKGRKGRACTRFLRRVPLVSPRPFVDRPFRLLPFRDRRLRKEPRKNVYDHRKDSKGLSP